MPRRARVVVAGMPVHVMQRVDFKGTEVLVVKGRSGSTIPFSR